MFMCGDSLAWLQEVFCILCQVYLLVNYFRSIFPLRKNSNENCHILEVVTDGKTKS